MSRTGNIFFLVRLFSCPDTGGSMAVCRVEKNKYYTTMSNYHLRDPNLSNKARGLLSTMLSLPDNWDYTTRGLARICKDGVDGITAQLKELEQYGYLVRHRIRDSTGRITDMEYIIYERPHTASPDTEKPYMVKPDMALPRLETPAQINIDKRITEEINTDSVNTHSILSDGSRPSVLAALEAKRKEVSVRDMDEYREIIMENIDYDILRMDMPYDHDRLEEILELIVETVCSNKKYIRVAGTDYPAEVVRSRLDRAVVVALIDKILIHSNDVVEIIYRWQDEFAWQLDILRSARLQEVV